jgi:hypothetical protein
MVIAKSVTTDSLRSSATFHSIKQSVADSNSAAENGVRIERCSMPASAFPQPPRARNERPAIASRVVLQGLQTKQQVIGEVIAGRLGLLEAASRFLAVHHATAACFEFATGIPSVVADNESICRTVIGWVYLTLHNRPEEAERVSNRLERELQSLIERAGTVNLASRR